MNGAEFIRRMRKLGKARGVPVEFRQNRGKGSHGTLYFGNRRTVVKDRRKELAPGLLHAMLRQLGLNKSDLE